MESPDAFDFLDPPPWLSDMKINSSPPSNGSDDKELNRLLKAINRQMDKSSLKNSNCFAVPITLSVADYADDLFNNPGEESESMQGSARGDAELIPLATFPQPTGVPYPSASGS